MNEKNLTPRSAFFGWFPPASRAFGGGGRTQPAATPAIAQAPVTAAAPPVTSASSEVVQAQQDARRQALKRRGFSKTIFAGDTGGWGGNNVPGPANPRSPNSSPSGAKTLGS